MRRTLGYPLLLFTIVSMLGLGGCKMPLSPEFRGVSDFKLNRKNEDKRFRFRIGVDVYNPNKYKVNMISYNLRVYVEDKLVGEAHEKRKQTIPKLSTETLNFSVQTNLKNVLGSLGGLVTNLLSGKEGLNMRFEGKVRARALGIGKTIPVNYTRLVKWQELRR